MIDLVIILFLFLFLCLWVSLVIYTYGRINFILNTEKSDDNYENNKVVCYLLPIIASVTIPFLFVLLHDSDDDERKEVGMRFVLPKNTFDNITNQKICVDSMNSIWSGSNGESIKATIETHRGRL